ncbi:MAG TPA: DUF2934 domain-containing protein [Gallionella sp.]|nr:DUF2934 domain-containing protein [Gallionella sp.]
MDQNSTPLYGELVIPFADKSQATIKEQTVMQEQSRLMIEEAAYYLAEKRGFAPGQELEDWLQAEAQILKLP